MTSAWFHIITVHLPVIGTPIVLYLVLKSIKEDTTTILWKRIYSLLILLAILVSISYFSGPTTAEWIKEQLDHYPKALVENHALWGRIAFTIQVMLGVLGIMGLSNNLQGGQPIKKLPWIILILLAVNTLILIYTAHLGGMIRRPDFIF